MNAAACSRGLVLTLLACWLAGDAWPQPARDTIPVAKLLGESPRAAVRLANAQNHVEQRQWSDAIEAYQSILEESGEELVPLDPPKPTHSVSARRVCQLRLAALPPEGLRLYCARVDPPAKKLLDQALPNRDPALLQRLAEEYFLSRSAEKAIDLLGDLAFERGDFSEAQRWWSLLARPASAAKAPPGAGSLQLTYPDLQGDPALVRAKLILALLFRGDRAAALAELPHFRALHPKDAGPFAGRTGNYGEILKELLDRQDLTPPVEGDLTWPTFGGAPSRSATVPQMPRCRWLEETWRVRLDGKEAGDEPATPPGVVHNASQANRPLAFHPAILGNQVLVAEAGAVNVFDLLSGKRRGRYDLAEVLQKAVPGFDAGLPVKHDERFTLSVAENRLYVRLGTTALGNPVEAGGKAARAARLESFLVCLDLPSEGSEKLTVRWQTSPPAAAESVTLYEGAPVVVGNRAAIAWSRFKGSVATTAIDCYDSRTGQRRWRQEVCESNELADNGEPRYRQQLLTLAGPNIVYCSHSGAIVALDHATGRRAWGVRYPRRGYWLTEGARTPRDLAPAVYADGRVYVAPADCDRILCLDSLTGRTLWESKPVEVLHLLGVARGKLIFTTGSAPRGIRALDAASGNDLRGWVQPEDGQGELPSLGRGILAGDCVLWPTVRDGLRILNIDDGRVSDQHFLPPGSVRSGNLAIGNGCVVVATDRELRGYVPPGRLLEQRKKAAAAEPKSAAAIYRLAVAEADAELDQEAANTMRKAWSLRAAEDRLLRDRLRIGTGRLLEYHVFPGIGRTFDAIRYATAEELAENDHSAWVARASKVRLELALPLQRSWQSPLAAAEQERFLTRGQGLPNQLLTERKHGVDGELLSRSPPNHTLHWRTRLFGRIAWVGLHDHLLLIADTRAVCAFRSSDCGLIWEFVQEAWPWNPTCFGGYQLTSSMVAFLEEQRRLIVLDPDTGKLLWNLWAPAAHIRPLEPAGKFHPLYHAGKERVLIQTSLGRTWLLDSTTGKKLAEPELPRGLWVHPPFPLGEDRVCVIDDRRHVSLLNLTDGKVLWTHTIDRPHSWSGAALQVLGNDKTLLLGVPRNYGFELESLDPANGAPRWRKPVLLPAVGPDLTLAALDDKAIYLAHPKGLEAIALADGQRLWKVPLQGVAGPARVIAGRGHLLVHPLEARVEIEQAALLRRYLAVDPTALTPTLAPLAIGKACTTALVARQRALSPSRFSLNVYDARDGQLVQRLNFAGQGSSAQVQLFDKQIVVALGGAVWGLQ